MFWLFYARFDLFDLCKITGPAGGFPIRDPFLVLNLVDHIDVTALWSSTFCTALLQTPQEAP